MIPDSSTLFNYIDNIKKIVFSLFFILIKTNQIVLMNFCCCLHTLLLLIPFIFLNAKFSF